MSPFGTGTAAAAAAAVVLVVTAVELLVTAVVKGAVQGRPAALAVGEVHVGARVLEEEARRPHAPKGRGAVERTRTALVQQVDVGVRALGEPLRQRRDVIGRGGFPQSRGHVEWMEESLLVVRRHPCADC